MVSSSIHKNEAVVKCNILDPRSTKFNDLGLKSDRSERCDSFRQPTDGVSLCHSVELCFLVNFAS